MKIYINYGKKYRKWGSVLYVICNRYILLKERNRLLTMEEEYRHQHELFPSPERIDKVNH
jgi:hypothetical protein